MRELYHAEPVANSMKVLIWLKEDRLDFVSHYIALLLFEQHTAEYLAINPNGQAPVLIHNRNVITESTVINKYLDDVCTEPAARAIQAIPNDVPETSRVYDG